MGGPDAKDDDDNDDDDDADGVIKRSLQSVGVTAQREKECCRGSCRGKKLERLKRDANIRLNLNPNHIYMCAAKIYI